MRSCKEMRQEAWNILTGSKWGWKIAANYLVLTAISGLIVGVLFAIYDLADIQTWESFRQAQAVAKRSGIELAVPSAREAWRMTFASGFSTFIQYLFQSILIFGLVTTLVKCIKGEEEGWFSGAFSGFKRPLGLLWLTVLMIIKVLLWSLLLIIPGIIACFRYALAWYVKAENPELGANACLKRSGEMMKGRKLTLALFGLSYIGWILLVVIPFFFVFILIGVLGATANAEGANVVTGVLSLMLLCAIPAMFAAMLFVIIYIMIGQAVFYRDTKAEIEGTGDAAAIGATAIDAADGDATNDAADAANPV